MTNATLDRIKLALKNAQPAAVVVVMADGEQRELAPGGKRARWAPILAALCELPWVTLELRDRRGRIIGAPLQNDGAAAELESLSPATSARVGETAQLVGVVTRASKDHIELLTATIRPTLDTARDLARDALSQSTYWREEADRQRARADDLDARLRKAEKRLVELVTAHEHEDSEGWAKTVGEIASSAPQLLQMLHMGMRLLKPGPAAPPPRPPTSPPVNGAPRPQGS